MEENMRENVNINESQEDINKQNEVHEEETKTTSKLKNLKRNTTN